VTERDPTALYRAAQRAATRMSGNYNENVRVDTSDGPRLVRIPIPRADQMDLRIWPEWKVLGAISPDVEQVPRLLHVSEDPPFQIHEFVEGRQLNQLAPRGRPVPATVIPDVLALFGQLAGVTADRLPTLPAGWPDDGQCSDFARLLSDATQQIYDENHDTFGGLFRALGIPEYPLVSVTAAWSALIPRPFRLIHADLHRQNMLLSSRGVVFLDWELALWGDPVYDLAVHVSKMTYLDNELRALLTGWEARAGSSTGRCWRDDLTAYLRHEWVKAAIVDTLRFTREIVAEHTTAGRRQVLIGKLTGTLNSAGQVWGWRHELSNHDVTRIIAGARVS
jgi:aminoglycoside phosphotransferase (APT) family kinase protein